MAYLKRRDLDKITAVVIKQSEYTYGNLCLKICLMCNSLQIVLNRDQVAACHSFPFLMEGEIQQGPAKKIFLFYLSSHILFPP